MLNHRLLIHFGEDKPSPAERSGSDAEKEIPSVESYSEFIAGSPHLELREVPPSGQRTFPWLFTHRPNARAAVHALTIVKNEQGEEFVHLLVQKRPPLGGKQTIELPAGLWGDQNSAESILEAAEREVHEETGYDVTSCELLTDNLLASPSPGLTDERKALALVRVSGNPSDQFREADEREIIVGTINLPLATFVDHDRFKAWLQEMDQRGYIVDMSILAARGVMPPDLGKKLDVQG